MKKSQFGNTLKQQVPLQQAFRQSSVHHRFEKKYGHLLYLRLSLILDCKTEEKTVRGGE